MAVASMVNLGGIYRQQGELDISDSLITQSLAVAKKTGMFHLVSIIYLNGAQLGVQFGNYSDANKCLDSAEVYQKYTPSNDVQMGIYQINYAMFKKRGDFETALNYYQKLKNFQDSINENGRSQVISELHLKYDYEKKEK